MALNPYAEDTISTVSSGGNHVLVSGKTAKAITSEALKAGDNVILVKDDTGALFILAGKK
jgi:hypothetical protein